MAATSLELAEPHHRTDEWVPALCAQFSDVTGWPLRYVPHSHLSQLGSTASAEPCWKAEVRNGLQTVGQLRLDPPHNSSDTHSFAAVSQFSQLLADLLEQVFTATRQSAAETHDSETLFASGFTAPQGSEVLASIKQLMRAGLQLTSFRSACLFLVEPGRQELRMRAIHQLKPQELPCPIRALNDEPPDLQVLSSGIGLVLRRGNPQSDAWLPADASTGFCLPVQATCGGLGTLWFFDRRQRSLEPSEKRLLNSLSTQIGSLLEQIAMRRESATHERLRHEVLSLNESDADSPIRSLRKPHFEASWRVSSRFEIGGDLCEITQLSSHEFALMIGDATGNSVPAAIVMTAVHGAIAALLADNQADAHDTARVLTLVNRSLFHTRRLPHFMSLIYGVLDLRKLKFTYSNAGHPSLLLLRKDETISLDSRNVLLGIIEHFEYTSDTIDLLPRDVLLGYSDGVSEARNVDSQFFGRDGILHSLGSKMQETDTLTLLNRVWNRQTAFAAPGHADDRCLLMARVLSD